MSTRASRRTSKRTSKRIWTPAPALILVAALVLVALGASGCGGSASARRSPNTVVIGQTEEPATFDPHYCDQLAAARVQRNIFDTLIRADGDGQPQPSLAASWEISGDGLLYTFRLRQDATFHNGDPFTARDVQYSLQRAMASPYCREAAGAIQSVAVIDDYTVQVSLRYVYPPQLKFFAATQLSIVNQNLVTGREADFADDPTGAGTGAYRFEARPEGEGVTLTANEGYFGGKPAIATVIYRGLTAEGEAAGAMAAGEIDLFLQPAPADLAALRDDSGLIADEAVSDDCEYLAINITAAPFDRLEVRQALALAVDKGALILAGAGEGQGVPTGTIVGRRVFGYAPALANPQAPDRERARRLLAAAGFPNGFECAISTVAGSREKVAEAYKEALALIGVDATVNVLPADEFAASAGRGDGQLFVTGALSLSDDGDPILSRCFGAAAVGATNFSRYSDDEFEYLLGAERLETDPEKREAILRQMQQLVYREIPAIPSYFRLTTSVRDKNLRGFPAAAHNLFYADELSW